MHLFGFLGMSNYVPCAYLAPWQEEHSPPVTYVQTASALALQERAPIEEISILCTVESRDKHARGLRQEFEAYDLEVTRVVEVPSELGRQGVLELFDRLADILPGDSKRLAFDMTHGFRAQPAVAMLFLNYLQAVDPEVEIAHLLYGAFERGQRQAPLVDLIDLWALRDWGYGFLSFHRTGDTSKLHTMTQRAQDDYCRSGHVPSGGSYPELGSFAGRLKELHHHASLNRVPGLFGEDGLLQAMHNEVARDWNPISEEVGRFVAPLREQLREQLEVFLVDEWHSLEGLGAQLRWIDWLRQHGSYQEALTIAREWSITLLARGISGRESPEARANAEKLHGELASPKKPDEYSPILVRLLKLFGEEFGKDANRITSMRNKINHAFMPLGGDDRTGKVNPAHLLENIQDSFGAALAAIRELSPAGTALFTSVGLSPGVLYTAVREHEPDVVAVLTSEAAREGLEGALERLTEEGFEPEVHLAIVEDPFTGFEEAHQTGQELLTHARANNVLNIAGGTTAMQHALSRLRPGLGEFGRTVRQGAVIDRRDPATQRDEPFVQGEWVWLEDE